MKILLGSFLFFFSLVCQSSEVGDFYNLYKNDPDLKMGIKNISVSASDRWKRSHGDIRAFFKQDYDDDAACIHCPSHFKLAGDVNKIIEKIPKNSADSKEDAELVPIKLNKLKFLYYVSKSNLQNQESPCKIQMLSSGVDSVQEMKGQFQLAYEDILPYSDIGELQLYMPDSEKVIYYYRGEGAQSNVFIEAVLEPHGKATFRYFYYTPPSTNEFKTEELATLDTKKKDSFVLEDFLRTDTMRLERRGFIPRNLHLLETEGQKTFYEDYKLNMSNDLSLLGNNLNMSLRDSKTNKELMTAEIKVKTSGDKQEYKVNVPLNIGYYEKSEIKSNVSVDNQGEAVSLTLTDYDVDWFRAEVRRDSATGRGTYYLEKITNLAPQETLVTRYGLDNNGIHYLSLQHKKDINKSITMVLDARYGINGETTLMYQLGKKF